MKGNKKRAEEKLMDLRKSFVVPTTFGGYQTTVEKKFIPYFEPKQLALANVQAKDLQSFYLHEMKTLSGTTVKHEHALIRKQRNTAIDGKAISKKKCSTF